MAIQPVCVPGEVAQVVLGCAAHPTASVLVRLLARYQSEAVARVPFLLSLAGVSIVISFTIPLGVTRSFIACCLPHEVAGLLRRHDFVVRYV